MYEIKSNNHNNHYKFDFLTGEMDDIVSISCGDKTVAITPMNEFEIDLEEYVKIIKNNIKNLKTNRFFINYKIYRYDITIFKQGRMLIKGIDNKETAITIYRDYFGS